MPSNREVRLAVAWKLIESDLAFATRFVGSGQRNEKSSWLAIYGMLPHLSMIGYELVNFLQRHYPEIHQNLTLQNLQTIENSRNTAKHLDDGRADAAEVVELEKRFEIDVIEHYRSRFAPPKNWLGRLLRRLYKDLGLYFYEGTLVATTHSAGYALGIPLTQVTSDSARERMENVSVELGQLLGALGHGIEPDATSFLDYVDSAKITMRDVHSSQYYARSRGRPSDELIGLHALISVLQTSVNFLDVVTPLESDTASIVTLVKLRLVTCIHVVASCRRILGERGTILDRETRLRLENVASGDEADVLLSMQIRRIRNAVVHYMPNRDFGPSDYREDKPLWGIVEKYAPGLGFVDIGALAYRETSRVASELNAWERRG